MIRLFYKVIYKICVECDARVEPCYSTCPRCDGSLAEVMGGEDDDEGP